MEKKDARRKINRKMQGEISEGGQLSSPMIAIHQGRNGELPLEKALGFKYV